MVERTSDPIQVGDAILANGYNAFGVVQRVNQERGIAFVTFASGAWVELSLPVAESMRLSLTPAWASVSSE